MALDTRIFEAFSPSRFISFTFPNPLLSAAASPSAASHCCLNTPSLRVAVLDSPEQPTTDAPRIAAMLVPLHREIDWIFSTEAGHLQLILNCPDISRLILIGNDPSDFHPMAYDRPEPIDPIHRERLEVSLTPLLTALLPKLAFGNSLPEIPFVTYEDAVIRSVIVERCVGPMVGEMIVEDVELEDLGDCRGMSEFRRRLRFKRMPNLIQTQMRILPNSDNGILGCVSLGDVKFGPEIGVLVHPYLTPMVAGLSLMASHFEERLRCGYRPKALCLGVGGGALLSFLSSQLAFEVVGIEADEVVLGVARRHFGLEEGHKVRVLTGDAIKFVEQLASQIKDDCYLDGAQGLDTRFDVIMVDLDSSEARLGLTAPALEFVKNSVLVATRLILSNSGILVVNVIPPSRPVYETLIDEFRQVFEELFEIDVGNEENWVLIAAASPIVAASSECDNSFLGKLKLLLSGAYMHSIQKV